MTTERQNGHKHDNNIIDWQMYLRVCFHICVRSRNKVHLKYKIVSTSLHLELHKNCSQCFSLNFQKASNVTPLKHTDITALLHI